MATSNRKTNAEIPPTFAAVIAGFKSNRAVTYGGKGFGSTALKVNGRIFAMLSSKGKFVVKLPKARVTELVEAGQGKYFDPGRGRLMKEWLVVSASSKSWIEFAREACRFVKAIG